MIVDPSAACFNRNIVECKCGYAVTDHRADNVLIETLWNVNSDLPGQIPVSIRF